MGQSFAEAIFWIAAAACAAADSFILLSSFRAARTEPRRSAAAWEAVWAILPALALAFLLSATWTAIHRGQSHDKMNMPVAASNG